MSELSYWEKRAAQRMFEYMEDAEKAADELSRIYYAGSQYINFEINDIFDRLKSKHHLSDAEARRLLNLVQDRTSYDELLNAYKNSSLDQNKNEALAQLESPAYRARIQRLEELQGKIDNVMQNIYRQEKAIATEHYVDLATESYYKSLFDVQQRVGLAFDFNVVDPKMVDRVLNSKWSGENYSQRIWGNTQMLAQTLKEELLISLLTGKSEREAANILVNKFAQSASNARRLVRTESCHISNQMTIEAFKECGIDAYIFVATLDLKTSKPCRELDGKRFKVSEQEPGKNCPPMHPWCRSCIICDISDEALAKMQRIARDPVTGKAYKVPANMTYDEWHDKYVKGSSEAETAEKMIKNRSADRRQFEKYKGILPDKAPKALDDFQKMKYNDSEQWERMRLQFKDEKLRVKIRSDATNKTIHEGKQGKHILGHNNYKDSGGYLTISQEQAQELVDRYAGTGEIVRSNAGKYMRRERIRSDQEIGAWKSYGGETHATNSFIIHYSKDGVHIVPARKG